MDSAFRDDLTAMIPHLRAFARSLTGGDRDLADDLVQETLVKSMQAEARFEPGTNLRAWLFTILRNTFCSYVGRKRHKVEVHDDDLEQLAWTAAPQEGRLEAIAFRRAFKRLSTPHREALVLSVIQGHSYESVAAICGCEVGTVKSRVNRARAQLREMLLEGDLPMRPVHRRAVEVDAPGEAVASPAGKDGRSGGTEAWPRSAAAAHHVAPN
jgi:RNA polymerase sigma-70 factor (ECF subfamily)